MALLAAMVAKRVSRSTLPLWRPLSLGPLTHSPFAGALTHSPFAGVSSRALFVSAHFMRHTLALPLTHVSSSGARLQPQSIVSRSSTQADAPLLHIVQEILQFHSLVFRNPPDLPTHRCGAALDIILSTPFLQSCVTINSGSNCCSAPLCFLPTTCCAPVTLTFTRLLSLPNPFHPPSLLRVRDWSTVVASCHHSLSVWHQSVLAHPLTFLRVLPLWTLSSTPSRKSSLTVHTSLS